MALTLERLMTRLSCTLWGHRVDNGVFARSTGPTRTCQCGTTYLSEDRSSLTRVRHTLSCFLGHHSYEQLVDRDHWHEYVCVQCGHPLLFREDRDPYAALTQFRKKVRYLCGLFGHRVERVGARDGFVEYACHCGHTFLHAAEGLSTIHHPTVCVIAGHWIQFLTKRAGVWEYVCRNCGHPFCFADPGAKAATRMNAVLTLAKASIRRSRCV
jgi:hypothetical protein